MDVVERNAIRVVEVNHLWMLSMAVSEYNAATAMATARCPRHHALKYRTSVATPLATVVAVAAAANSDTPYLSF